MTAIFRHFRPIRRFWPVFALGAAVGCYGIFLHAILPGIVQTQAEKLLADHGGHRLSMDRPRIDPWTLSIEIKNLRLTTAQGAPLLRFDDLFVDFSAESLFRRAYVFDAVRLRGAEATLALYPNNRLNWSTLFDAFKSNKKQSGETPRLIVKDIVLDHAHVRIADERDGSGRKTEILPLDLHLTDLTTLPGQNGHLILTAQTDFDAHVRIDSQTALKPPAFSGTLSIAGASLAKLAAIAPPGIWPATLAPPRGTLAVAFSYRITMDGPLSLTLNRIDARIEGLHVSAKTDPTATLDLGTVRLHGGRFDLHAKRFHADTLAIDGGASRVLRTRDGTINLMHLLPAPAGPSKTEHSPAAQTRGKDLMHWSIGRIAVSDFALDLADAGSGLKTQLRAIALDVRGASQDMTKPLAITLGLDQVAGGHFTAAATVIPAAKTADVTLTLAGLALAPVQPILTKTTTLHLAGGSVSAQGHMVFDGKNASFDGGFSLDDLRLTENRQTLLAWKRLATDTVQASPDKLNIREMTLVGLDTRLIIAHDKTINFTKIVKAAPPRPNAPRTAARPLPVRIARLRIRDGQMEFADQSLALPFGTHIHALSGTVTNIATTAGKAPARLQLEGQIDEYGMARAAGRLDTFHPTDLLDIKVGFKNVEMTHLTPYSATFAGRRIDSGKLSLDLEYKIRNRELSGDNRIVMDRLTLGERVESPGAHNLPLDLAIAILEDADGRIDLGLPVSGNLNNPKFSIRGIVWQAITNVFTKIVTSPFRALGILGGSDDRFDGLSFEAGRTTLTPPEREKLAALAESLTKHPRLTVAVVGTFSEADRTAIQDLHLRQAIAGKLGLAQDGDPGLITPDQPKVKAALESLYSERFGRGALSSQKDAFLKANPGSFSPSTADKIVSALTGILGTKPVIGDDDIAALKGKDLHVTLYAALRANEPVPDAALQALAAQRADTVLAGLAQTKLPAARISRKPVAKVNAADAVVPLTLEMGAATP